MIRKITYMLLIFMISFSIFFNNPVLGHDQDDPRFQKKGSSSQTTTDTSTPDGIITGANDFITEGEKNVGNALNTDGLASTSNFIYNLLLAIAMIVAMAVGIAIGIKFMMASASEKAEVKELLLPYVLGCIVVFGAMGIWKLAVNVFSGF